MKATHKCTFCSKEFIHASGLSWHKTESHSEQRALLKEAKNRPGTHTCTALLMHLVAEGIINKQLPNSANGERYASMYNMISNESTTLCCDTLEFIKLILTEPLQDYNGKLIIAFGAFRYSIPIFILDQLGCISEKEINIPHNFLFLEPIGVINAQINLKIALYDGTTELETPLRMIVKYSVLDTIPRRELAARSNFHVRTFYPMCLSSGNHEIDVHGLFGGLLYIGSPQRIKLTLNHETRFDYSGELLEHISETVGDFKYLSINCDTFQNAFNAATQEGERIDSMALEIIPEAGCDRTTVYFDLLSRVVRTDKSDTTKLLFKPLGVINSGVSVRNQERVVIISDAPPLVKSEIEEGFLYWCDNCCMYGPYEGQSGTVRRSLGCHYCGMILGFPLTIHKN